MKLTDPVSAVIAKEFNATEINLAETRYAILDPSQAEDFCAALARRHYLKTLEPTSLAALREQCVIAFGWHSAPSRPEDELAPNVCWRCGFVGNHPTAQACIDHLRDTLAELEWSATSRRRRKRQA